MQGASCSLELLDMVLIEHSYPEEIEDVMASDTSKDVSRSGF